MSRIGGIGSLATDQLRALSRIAELGQAISKNQQRLSTLKRINSAADDPAGLVAANLLPREITAAEAASSNVTRASAILNTADAAAGEIVEQLQNARTLALEAAGGTLSDADIAANQVQLDQILSTVDDLAGTSFNGQRLLDGSAGVRVSGVDYSKVQDVDVLRKDSAGTETLSITLNTQATQGSGQYTGGALAGDTTLLVTGPSGSASVTIASGADATAIATAIDGLQELTGLSAVENGGNVEFTTVDYGSDATFAIEATSGAFALSTGPTAGTDATATINGKSVTADGATFSYVEANLSVVIEVDPSAATGAIDPINLSGEGLAFEVGVSPGSKARVNLPTLNTASLGGATGRLSTLRSGGANSLTSGNAAEAVAIIDSAIADATRSRAVIGGFQKYTLGSASRLLDSTIENTSDALSDIMDTDLALESALLSNNQLLQQTTLESLSITSMRNNDVLSLLRTAARL